MFRDFNNPHNRSVCPLDRTKAHISTLFYIIAHEILKYGWIVISLRIPVYICRSTISHISSILQRYGHTERKYENYIMHRNEDRMCNYPIISTCWHPPTEIQVYGAIMRNYYMGGY